jgi:hypothetical protein
MVILSFFLFSTCNRLNIEKKSHTLDNKLNSQNRLAMLDSVTKSYNSKIDMWEFEKSAYVLKQKDLEIYNKGLSDTIKKLKGKIAILISTQGTIDLGKITIGNKLVKLEEPNHYGLNFKSQYEDPGLKQIITGQSRFFATPDKNTITWNIQADSTLIDTNIINIKVIYGFKELDKQFNVFAISSSPKITFTDLTGGYFIDKQPAYTKEIIKPKKWGFGPYIGFGINTDFNLRNPRFGWSGGFSFNYNIFQW